MNAPLLALLLLLVDLGAGDHTSRPQNRDRLRKGFWGAPLQLNNGYHDVGSYENLQIRKRGRSERFDGNEMIFVTEPRHDLDRRLDELMNDMIALKTQKLLRQKNGGGRSRIGRYGFGFDQLVS